MNVALLSSAKAAGISSGENLLTRLPLRVARPALYSADSIMMSELTYSGELTSDFFQLLVVINDSVQP